MNKYPSLVLICLWVSLLLSGCNDDTGLTWGCTTDLLDEISDSTGTQEVAVWRRGCGATSPEVIQVQYLKGANTDVIRYDQSDVFFVADVEFDDLLIVWNNPETITITIQGAGHRVYRNESEIGRDGHRIAVQY